MRNGKVAKKRVAESTPMLGKLVSGVIIATVTFGLAHHPEVRAFAQIQEQPSPPAKKMGIDTTLPEMTHTEPLTASTKTPTEVAPEPAASTTPVVPVKDNETIIWERLIAEGFTRNQTAGIMGNLQQEHNFKTDDVAGGLGIAQWIGNRRANLMARADYLNINVQLDFLMEELRGGEKVAYNAIIAVDSLENAVISFQNKFERCNPYYCNPQQRINYAYGVLGRH